MADKNASVFLPLNLAIPIEKDKWNGSFDFILNCRTLYLICFFKAKAYSSDLSFAKITNSSPPIRMATESLSIECCRIIPNCMRA